MALAAPVVVFLATVAAAAAVRLLLAYLKFRRLELAIPGPASLPLLGNTLDCIGLTEDTVLSTMMRLWGGRHSQLSRISVMGRLAVFVSDPDHLQELFRRKDMQDKSHFYRLLEPIQNGLVTLNGALWHAHRRALQPAFHQSVLDKYTSVFSAEALACAGRIRPGEAQGVVDNLHTLMARAFVLTAFSMGESDEEEVARMLPDMKALDVAVSNAFSYRCFQPWLWPEWVFGLTEAGTTIRRLKTTVDAFFLRVVASRRAQLKERSAESRVSDGLINSKRRPLMDVMLESQLSDAEMVCEAEELAGAAVDTTAATLSWVLKSLSLKQDVQQRLLQEVEEVLGKDAATRTDTISNDDINRLEYMERVIKETLRLLPGAPIVARETKVQTEFCGYTLPAGTTLILNILGAHRHPGHWPDPLRFDPDRFLPENSVGRHPCAFVAFSAGARNCIGSRYAMMLMKTLLATLVPRYRIDPVPGEAYKEPSDLPMASGLASRMVGGARVVFTPRPIGGCAA